jgi:ribonucleotide monophosphatase NagD (HAD superfamily)
MISDKEVPPGFEKDLNNLAIDFDGVIHNFDKGWHDGTCYGEPLPGALEAIARLANKYNIIIFTAKAKPSRPLVNGKTGTELVSEWLEKHSVLQFVDEITAEKPRSQVYIDDKGYHFQNWEDTLKYLEEKDGKI